VWLSFAQEEGTLKTHSMHADIVVNLSGSKHIAAALGTFGVTGNTKELLVAMINASGRDPPSTLYKIVPNVAVSSHNVFYKLKGKK
jgi:hypothetical protein